MFERVFDCRCRERGVSTVFAGQTVRWLEGGDNGSLAISAVRNASQTWFLTCVAVDDEVVGDESAARCAGE
jgi:hypothetical protein